MHVEPDTVTGAVQKIFAVPLLGDVTPRNRIDLLRCHTGAYRLERLLLSVLHDLINRLKFVGRPADVKRARDVRTVILHPTAEVDDERVALLNRDCTRLVMRRRGV